MDCAYAGRHRSAEREAGHVVLRVGAEDDVDPMGYDPCHRHRIIAEEDETRKAVLIATADIARRQLTAALGMLGISVPERM